MKLLICNFKIVYKSEKINSINASLRQFDYKNENISANYLLLILQWKLTRIESLNSFMFIAIKELYYIYVEIVPRSFNQRDSELICMYCSLEIAITRH